MTNPSPAGLHNIIFYICRSTNNPRPRVSSHLLSWRQLQWMCSFLLERLQRSHASAARLLARAEVPLVQRRHVDPSCTRTIRCSPTVVVRSGLLRKNKHRLSDSLCTYICDVLVAILFWLLRTILLCSLHERALHNTHDVRSLFATLQFC